MTKKNKVMVISGLAVCILSFIALSGLLITLLTESTSSSQSLVSTGYKNEWSQETTAAKTEVYNPTINPTDFTTKITNPYFSMSIGKKMAYLAEIGGGVERTEILIPGWTKTIMGVKTLVFWDRVYLNGELIEDTRDYIAQDKEGNVWYFGENVDNYVAGKLIDHKGAWIGGIDGALPGIWMKANPKVGDEYRQEYYIDEAEDMGRIDAIGVKIVVPAGTYTDCVKVFEWSPLEDATAYKYYCSVAGAVVLEQEEEEQVKLIELNINGSNCMRLPNRYQQEGVEAQTYSGCDYLTDSGVSEKIEKITTKITEEEAKEIALKTVPGRVTDIEVEKKFGKLSYIVEVDADNGPETDVIINMNNGEVLDIED